jgi:hypothetical protein
MKTLNIFYPVIYWTQKEHNDFIILRSLHCVQHKCSDYVAFPYRATYPEDQHPLSRTQGVQKSGRDVAPNSRTQQLYKHIYYARCIINEYIMHDRFPCTFYLFHYIYNAIYI